MCPSAIHMNAKTQVSSSLGCGLNVEDDGFSLYLPFTQCTHLLAKRDNPSLTSSSGGKKHVTGKGRSIMGA